MHILTLFIITATLSLSSSLQWYQQNNPHFITHTQLQSLKATDHTTIKIIKYFTPWCRYCRFMKAHFQTYKSSHEISKNLKFYEFNCANENMQVCGMSYHISGFPTIIAYDQQGNEINRIAGMYPQNVIMRFLDDLNQRAKVIEQSLEKKPEENSASTPLQQQTKQPNKQEPASNPPQENTQQLSNTAKPNPVPNADPDKPQIRQDKVQIPTQEQEHKEASSTQQQKKTGISISNIMKYLFYLFTAVIGGYYGLHVFKHKYEGSTQSTKDSQQSVKFVKSVQIESKNLEGMNEEQLKAEDVSDENL